MAQSGELIGCFDLPNSVYHDRKCPGVSKSKLDLTTGTDEDFYFSLENPKEMSKDVTLGLALHTNYLENHLFNDQFYYCEFNKGTKKYKEDILSHEHKTILSLTHKRDIDGMTNKLLGLEMAVKLLKGHREYSFFWIDPYTGMLCKCRPDSVHMNFGALVDLKKTKDASKVGFMKSVFEFRYHVQDAFYSDGVREAIKQAGQNILGFKIPDKFVFVAVEGKAPYAHGYWSLPPVYVEEGRKEYRKSLLRFKQLTENKSKLVQSYARIEEGKERVSFLEPTSYQYKD